MNYRALALFALTLLLVTPIASAVEPRVTPWDPPWLRVEMKASKLFITTTSTVAASLEPSSRAGRQLMSPGEHVGLRPRSRQTARVEIGNSLLGRDSVTTLWLDPEDGRALQRIKVETGKKHRYKALRFTETGVLTVRRYPKDEGEEKKGPEHWSDRSQEFITAELADVPVTEPTGLLYLLAIAPLEKTGDRWTAAIFADDAVHRLEVKVEAITRLKSHYTCVRGDHEENRKGEEEVLHLSLRPKSASGKGSNFEFLGLEGDVDVYLHREDRYPVRITGKIPIAGRVNIELEQVELP